MSEQIQDAGTALIVGTLIHKAISHINAHDEEVRRFGFAWVAYLFSKKARRERDAFNSTLDQIAEIDPKCPLFRL